MHKESDAPLTERELEIKTLKLAQVGHKDWTHTKANVDTSSQARRSHTQGIVFPITPECETDLKELVSGNVQVVVMVRAFDILNFRRSKKTQSQVLEKALSTNSSHFLSTFRPRLPVLVSCDINQRWLTNMARFLRKLINSLLLPLSTCIFCQRKDEILERQSIGRGSCGARLGCVLESKGFFFIVDLDRLNLTMRQRLSFP